MAENIKSTKQGESDVINILLKLLCTATLSLGSVSVAQAQLGNLLKDLEKAAKELEKGIQQGDKPQTPGQMTPPPSKADQTPTPARNDREAAWKEFLASKENELKEYDEKSKEFASKAKTKWKSFVQSDAMTGKQTVIVRTEGKLGRGGYTADLYCLSSETVAPFINLKFTLQNLRPPTSPLSKRSTLMTSEGRKRVNGKVMPELFFQDEKFSNVYSVKAQDVFEGRLAKTESFGFTVYGKWSEVNTRDDPSTYEDCQKKSANSCYYWEGGVLKKRVGPLSFVYDSAYELTTNAGPIFLEVPPGNAAINKLIASCSSVSAKTSSTKQTETKSNTSLGNMDPRLVNFLGTWGGTTEKVLGTCKNEPVKITSDGIQVGKDRYPITFDSETDITLMDGATALRTQDKNTLIFFDSDGVEHEMKKCK